MSNLVVPSVKQLIAGLLLPAPWSSDCPCTHPPFSM